MFQYGGLLAAVSQAWPKLSEGLSCTAPRVAALMVIRLLIKSCAAALHERLCGTLTGPSASLCYLAESWWRLAALQGSQEQTGACLPEHCSAAPEPVSPRCAA